MYIKMNNDKSLVVTVETTIYRGETRADLITFLIPAQYEGINLADCAMTMRYLLPDGVSKVEPLAVLPEKYKTYLQFSTIVNTRLTAQAGSITVWLTAIDDILGTVLKTGECIVRIADSIDVSGHFQEEDLDQIDMLISKVSSLERSKADNLVFHQEDNTIQLTSGGVPIGDRIVISVDDGVCVTDVLMNESGELVVKFEDGTETNLGKIQSSGGVVYVPHVDDHKVLTFTIETEPGEIPPPVDLNPNDEWSDIDDSEVVSDYVWEDL